MTSSDRFGALDALRGFAALWVVLHHFAEGQHMPALLQALPPWVVTSVFRAGELGVSVFFVLSGVVMVLAVRRLHFDRHNAARFVWRRLVRLWPPYAVAVAFGVALLLAKRWLAGPEAPVPSAADVALHLVFLQDMAGVTPISAVFWTLCLEVQFYIVFALTRWSSDRLANMAGVDAARRERWRTWAWYAWGAIVLSSTVGALQMPMWRGSFLSFWYSFVAGVLCGLALVPGRHAVWVATTYAAVVALSAGLHAEAYAMTAGPTALFVIAMSRWPALQAALANSVLARLGLVSYSLYLFHNPVTALTMRVFRAVVGSGLPADLLALPVALAACIAAAVLVYLGIEKAAIGWSRSVTFRRGDEAPGLVRA